MLGFTKKVTYFDESAFRWILTRKNTARLVRLSRWISRCGDGGPYFLLAVVLAYFEPVYGLVFFKVVIASFAIELPSYLVLKNAIKRGRPENTITGFKAFLEPSDKFSFPSGHTAAAFLMAGIVSVYYPPFVLAAYCLACLIGLSRMFLGVHFPTDLLAGAVLGSVAAGLAVAITG